MAGAEEGRLGLSINGNVHYAAMVNAHSDVTNNSVPVLQMPRADSLGLISNGVHHHIPTINVGGPTAAPPKLFVRNVTVNYRTMCGNNVVLLPDSDVAAGQKVYLQGFRLVGNTLTVADNVFMVVTDSAGTIMMSSTNVNGSLLTGNPSTFLLNANTVIGGTAAKGLIANTNANAAAVGDGLQQILVWGFIK